MTKRKKRFWTNQTFQKTNQWRSGKKMMQQRSTRDRVMVCTTSQQMEAGSKSWLPNVCDTSYRGNLCWVHQLPRFVSGVFLFMWYVLRKTTFEINVFYFFSFLARWLSRWPVTPPQTARLIWSLVTSPCCPASPVLLLQIYAGLSQCSIHSVCEVRCSRKHMPIKKKNKS